MAGHLVPLGDQAVFIVPDDGAEIDVRVESETVWLTAAQMAALFGRDQSVIRRHVRKTFAEGEVPDGEGYRQNLPVTAPTGGRPEPAYNLDVVISVGYRVKSQRGVEFRRWATRVLKRSQTQGSHHQTSRKLDGRSQSARGFCVTALARPASP